MNRTFIATISLILLISCGSDNIDKIKTINNVNMNIVTKNNKIKVEHLGNVFETYILNGKVLKNYYFFNPDFSSPIFRYSYQNNKIEGNSFYYRSNISGLDTVSFDTTRLIVFMANPINLINNLTLIDLDNKNEVFNFSGHCGGTNLFIKNDSIGNKNYILRYTLSNIKQKSIYKDSVSIHYYYLP